MENDLDVLIGMINIAIKSLGEKHIDVIDEENQDFKMSHVYYDSDADKVIFRCEAIEEKKGVI